MKKLFKGLLVAGIGAAVGYIVAKKVSEKEENKETTREEAESLEKEEKVVEKAKEIITVVKNVVKSDEFFFFDILMGLAILSLYTEINHMKWKQHQLNLFDDCRFVDLAYNTKRLTKEEALSHLHEMLSLPDISKPIKECVLAVINDVSNDI